jgi:hypothetical protein
MTPEIANIVRRARELKTDIEDRVLGQDLERMIAAARAEAYEDAATLVERTNFAGEPLLAKIIAADIRLRAKTVSGWRPSSGE